MAEKNICSADIIESMSDATNVLVEEEGYLRRMNLNDNLPVRNGEGEYSVVGASGTAIGDYSVAIGVESISGAFAYTITAIDVDNKTYTLDAVDGLEVGDVYSVHVLYTDGTSAQQENYGTITGITDTVVTVDNLYCGRDFATADSYLDENGIDTERNTFRIIAKPTVGNRRIASHSYSEGYQTQALSKNAHAEGNENISYGSHSHTEGSGNIAGYCGHAEGRDNESTGHASHSEGRGNVSSGENSHSEGAYNTSSGLQSHTQGANNVASGTNASAEGDGTKATGNNTHTEGWQTEATGVQAHAEGSQCKAYGSNSHAEGNNTIARSPAQHVQGKYNVEDTENKYAHIIGGGTSSSRVNIHTVDWDGNAEFAGTVTATDFITVDGTSLIDLIGDIESLLAAI